MNKKNIFIIIFSVFFIYIGLFLLKKSIENDLNKQEIILLKLKEDAKLYMSLKGMKNSIQTLKSNISKLTVDIKPSSIKWKNNKVEISYQNLQRKMLDKIIKIFIDNGHTIDTLVIKKDKNFMNLKIGVKP